MNNKFLYYFTIYTLIAGLLTVFFYLKKIDRRFNMHPKNSSVVVVTPPYVKSNAELNQYKSSSRVTLYATKESAKKVYIGQRIKLIKPDAEINEEKNKTRNKSKRIKEKLQNNKCYNGKVIYISRISEPVPALKGIPDNEIFMSRKIIIETDTEEYFQNNMPMIILAKEITNE